MDKGMRHYYELIDELVKMSGSCADAANVEKGAVRGMDAEEGINGILAKLTGEERKVLARYVLSTYQSGIYDVLVHLEWLRECKEMKIFVEGEELPAGQYEGLPCDYIGRCKGWEWPDE